MRDEAAVCCARANGRLPKIENLQKRSAFELSFGLYMAEKWVR